MENNRWYDNKVLVIILIILFFPLGLYAMWKTTLFSKTTKLITTGIFSILVLVGIFSDPEAEKLSPEPTAIESKVTADTLPQEENDSKALEYDLRTELTAIYNKEFQSAVSRESLSDLKDEVLTFTEWGILINRGKDHQNKVISKLADDLKKEATKMQIKEFPLIRKQYVKIMHNDMWENNIECTLSGKYSQNITFIGGAFANNKNKADFQEALDVVFTLFRFKKSTYKFTEYDEKYNYYDIDSVDDSEIVAIKDVNFEY